MKSSYVVRGSVSLVLSICIFFFSGSLFTEADPAGPLFLGLFGLFFLIYGISQIVVSENGTSAEMEDLAIGVEFWILHQAPIPSNSTIPGTAYYLIAVRGPNSRVIVIRRGGPFESTVVSFTRLKNGQIWTKEKAIASSANPSSAPAELSPASAS